MDQAILPVIGVLRTPYTRLEDMPRQSFLAKEATGRAEVRPEYAPGLRDIAPGDRLELYFLFHEAEGWRPVVRTRRSGQREGRVRHPLPAPALAPGGEPGGGGPGWRRGAIVFAGVDMLDGSPLLDIKPGLAE